MFIAKSEITLIALHKQACSICKESNSCVLVLLKLMKTNHWAPYLIDEVKGTFGLRGSSLSESNHGSVKHFVLKYWWNAWCNVWINDASEKK